MFPVIESALGPWRSVIERRCFSCRQDQHKRPTQQKPGPGSVQRQAMTKLPAIFQVELANLVLQGFAFWRRGQLFFQREQLRRFPGIIRRGGKMLINHDAANQETKESGNPCCQ